MAFDSFAALIAMDGHGAYVWSAWGISALVLVALVYLPLRRHRQLLARRRELIAASKAPSPDPKSVSESGA